LDHTAVTYCSSRRSNIFRKWSSDADNDTDGGSAIDKRHTTSNDDEFVLDTDGVPAFCNDGRHTTSDDADDDELIVSG